MNFDEGNFFMTIETNGRDTRDTGFETSLHYMKIYWNVECGKWSEFIKSCLNGESGRSSKNIRKIME